MNRSNVVLNLYYKLADYLKLHQNISIISIASLIGVIGGYGAIAFRKMIDFVQNLSVGPGTEILDALTALPWYVKVSLPVLGGCVVGPLVYYFAREAKGHGVPEVMEAVALRGGRIRPRVVLVKSVASAVCLGTGGSVGREGPIVQIGSAAGSTLGQILKLSPIQIKTLVACGTAAGISATFNAPITGVLFAVEIILGNFAIHTFSPLVVSSVLATVISRHYLGNIPSFIVPHYNLKSPWELPLYLILGFIIAAAGLLFMNSIYKLEDLFEKWKIPEPLKNPAGMVGIGILLCFFPHIFGTGYQTITMALSEHIELSLLLLLIPVKIFATSLTLGSGGSGGVLAPSLFLGAVTGSAFGKIVHILLPSVTAESGAYGMVGMGAMVGAVTHAPVTAIITLFELTGDYKIILPVMFSCIFATMLTSTLKKDSIYTEKLSRRGVDINAGLESAIMRRHLVHDIMRIDATPLDPEMPFEKLFNLTLNSQQEHFYVAGLDNKYLGEICIHDLGHVVNTEGIHSSKKAIDVMNKRYPTVSPDENLLKCVQILATYGIDEVPVVDRETGEFLGVIAHRDIFNLYNREVLRQGTLGLKFITKSEETPRSDYVNIPSDYAVELLPVVGKLVDRSIQELDLRKKYDINILAVKKPEGQACVSELPAPDRILRRNEALVIVGKKENILKLRKDIV